MVCFVVVVVVVVVVVIVYAFILFGFRDNIIVIVGL